MKIKICLVFLLLSVAPVVFADELITNGGFETGLTSWSSAGGTVLSTLQMNSVLAFGNDGLVIPHSGARMAAIAPYGISDTALWQEVDFSGYTGATLSFWWKYDAWDLNEADYGIDRFQVLIGDGQQFWDIIWQSEINLSPSDGHIISPWMFASVSGDVSTLDKATFTFRVLNYTPNGEGDWGVSGFGQDTAIYLDDISIDAVPEPSSILLLATGIGAIGLAAWRRRK